MDTATVLEIIKRIRTRKAEQKERAKIINGFSDSPDFSRGYIIALSELQDHLQACIDGRLNAAENQTSE